MTSGQEMGGVYSYNPGARMWQLYGKHQVMCMLLATSCNVVYREPLRPAYDEFTAVLRTCSSSRVHSN